MMLRPVSMVVTKFIIKAYYTYWSIKIISCHWNECSPDINSNNHLKILTVSAAQCRDLHLRIHNNKLFYLKSGAVIVWLLDLHIELPMQSVPITTDVVSLNLNHREVYNIMITFQLSVTCDRLMVFSRSSGFLHQ